MLEIITPLLSTSAVAEVLWEYLQTRLKQKGVTAGPERLATADDVKRAAAAISEEDAKLPKNETYSLTIGALAAAHGAANGVRVERMRQARMTFNAALGLAVVGVLIIFAGIGLLLVRDAVTAGALTASVGAVVEVMSAVLLRLNQESNNRLDEVGKDLNAIEAAQIAVALINRIDDPGKRDDAIREAAADLRVGARRPNPALQPTAPTEGKRRG